MNTRFDHARAGAVLRFAALAACLALAACGGNVGGGSTSSSSSSSSSSSTNPVIVSIGANPSTLTVGESTMLTWSSSNASSCTASGAWSGSVALSGNRLVTPTAAGTYTYTLTCDGVAKSATVVAGVAPSAPVISMSLDPPSGPVGQPSTLTWSASNATACTASGAWSGSRATSGSTSVSQTVVGTYTYSLTCTGAGGTANGAVTLAATSLGSNVALVFIDNGPSGASNVINVPYVSVTLCRPGTSTCQTINHILLDTGSTGLRIIAPGVLDSTLALPTVNGTGGNPIGECTNFVSGYLWGSVRTADVKIGEKSAASLPVHVVGDSDSRFASVPFACSHTGSNVGSVARLGANGVLGIGLFTHDCGTDCVTSAASGGYYECSTSGCAKTSMPLAKQVANPVAAFASDNNGIVVSMPAVPEGGATTLTGALIFGIDTQSNNGVDTATVYTADATSGYFSTVYKGRTLANSFLDTGSNGYFFPDSTLPSCTLSPGFYCPSSTLSLSAVNTGTNSATGTVTFSIENLDSLSGSVRAINVGGSVGILNAFDWGMPFFYGRKVFVAFDGASTLHGTGPYWAY